MGEFLTKASYDSRQSDIMSEYCWKVEYTYFVGIPECEKILPRMGLGFPIFVAY
jgi:hypothetical protein